jgi:glycosyltransferase involved in cell wall biosynthesis
MNKAVSISVVTIVRNGSRFISDAIQSVFAQSHAVDVLNVVDGNTKGFKVQNPAPPGAIVAQQPGVGIGNARNYGIALSTCRYVAFLDHDDLWLPNKLARQIDALQRQPSSRFAIAMLDTQTVNTSDASVHPNLQANAHRGDFIGWTPSTFIAERTLFDDIGNFDEELKIASDMDFFARLIDSKTPGAELKEVLVTKRLHNSNLSIDVKTNEAEMLTVIERSIDRKKAADT